MKLSLLQTRYIYILIIFISSCSGLKDPENFEDSDLSIKAGDTSSVKMYANTLKGYAWVVSSNSDPDIAEYKATFIQLPLISSDQTTQSIRFKGLKKGKTIITLNYVKNGELQINQTRTIKLTVY